MNKELKLERIAKELKKINDQETNLNNMRRNYEYEGIGIGDAVNSYYLNLKNINKRRNNLHKQMNSLLSV